MSTKTAAGVRCRRSPGQWRRVIAAQAASGLSQQAYCRRHGIGYSSFCRWKRELCEPASSTAVGVPGAFVELAPMEPEAVPGWDVELELGGGVFLRLRRG